MKFIIRILLVPFYLVRVFFFLLVGAVLLVFALLGILFGRLTIAELSKKMEEYLSQTFKWFE